MGEVIGCGWEQGRVATKAVDDESAYDVDLVWDGVWSVRTAEVADGWSVEMAIPWATLRYPPGGAPWRVNFVRTVRGVGEMSGWSAWPRAFGPYRLEYGGDLVGLEPPPPTANLRVQPYTTGSGLARRDATDAGWQTTTDGDAGADLKWAITPQTVLDLTINTDFAQADVDRQVINLSRFSVFFPEWRPFFQENASLFAVGRGEALQPFFSRRVGLDDQGLPIPIHAGARLTTRSAGGQLGALLVHQGGAGAVSGSTSGVAHLSRLRAAAQQPDVPRVRMAALAGPRADVHAVARRRHRAGAVRLQSLGRAAQPPPSARFTASIDASTGEFYDGRMHQLSVAAAAVPLPNAALHLNYTLNALRDVGVVDTDLDAWILAPELSLALDPRVQLSTFYQYSSTDELTTWNARFSWEFRPLSYIYVVYNDRAFDTIDGIQAAPAERQLIVKFTYLQQF